MYSKYSFSGGVGGGLVSEILNKVALSRDLEAINGCILSSLKNSVVMLLMVALIFLEIPYIQISDYPSLTLRFYSIVTLPPPGYLDQFPQQ